jgi:hypothetical protein
MLIKSLKITKESMYNNGCLNLNATHKHCLGYDVALKVLQNNILLAVIHCYRLRKFGGMICNHLL